PMTLLLLYIHPLGDPPYLPSFPTRRSSDLAILRRPDRCAGAGRNAEPGAHGSARRQSASIRKIDRSGSAACQRLPRPPSAGWPRSEEHTSELQSRENLVCRLLLEKKNRST